MAEAVSNPNMLVYSPCGGSSGIGRHHHHRISAFPGKSAIFSCASAMGMGFPSLKLIGPVASLRSSSSAASSSDFYGRRVVFGGQQDMFMFNRGNTQAGASSAQMGIGIGKAQRWWEKGLQPNMKEVKGAQDLADSLLNAGDKLVVVDFFSPGCGGCKALHPKICQLAEMNPDVQFLQVNYEEHKSMCYTLHVHVLPFFRFYRGAHGRLCSFSCTNATIKKFKDALAKHCPDRCSLGPTKGLEEKELVALSANRDLAFNYTPKPEQPLPVPIQEEILSGAVAAPAFHSNDSEPPLPLPFPLESTSPSKDAQETPEKTLVSSARR